MPTLPPSSDSSPSDHPRRLPPTWREMHPDDDPAVEALQFAAWAAATPAEKLAQAAQLLAEHRRQIYLSILEEQPDCSEAELRVLCAERILGPELALRFLEAADLASRAP